METVRLSEENLPDYAEFIPEDIAEHISRIHYRGLIVAEDGRLLAVLIWTLKNTRENAVAGVESQIVWFDVAEDSEEAVTMLFSGYDEMIAYDDVVRSSFILPARTSKTEKSILKEQGFTDSYWMMRSERRSHRYSEKKPRRRIFLSVFWTMRRIRSAAERLSCG